MKTKICCIFNIAPHYNAAIYSLMDKELNCHFYLGDRMPYPIELMEYESLIGFKERLKYKPIFRNFYWQKGAIKVAFKSYEHYILTGEPYCVSIWILLLLNKLSGKKSYLWTHGWYGKESWLRKKIKKIFFGLSDKVFLYGNYARNLMVEQGINPHKLITIFNSLDYDTQIQIRQKLTDTLIYKQHFNNEYPVLLYIGRIQTRKKIELLVDAVLQLRKNGTFCNLIIIGKQIDNNIQEQIEKYNLKDFVWLYGPCYDEKKIGELIYNAGVCVVPGDIGLTAMHSLVFGTPVITHNNFRLHGPEFEAIVPGINGDFFEEGSIEDLCLKIISWISPDEEKKNSVREFCYKIIQEKYNPHKQINIIKTAISNSVKN
jgi:glycosyltransferase involved in cell wall biosynthesis